MGLLLRVVGMVSIATAYIGFLYFNPNTDGIILSSVTNSLLALALAKKPEKR